MSDELKPALIGVVLVALIVGLFWYGCEETKYGPEQEEPATVVGKHHRPAYTWVQMMPMSCGKNCMTVIPIVHNEPDIYTTSLRCAHGGFAVQRHDIYFNTRADQTVTVRYRDVFHKPKFRSGAWAHTGFDYLGYRP